MATARLQLPFPYPDPETGEWDAYQILRNFRELARYVETVASVALGGTGLTSYSVGDLLYAANATTLAKLAAVADGNVLRSAGVTTAPLWGKVRLSGATNDVTGTLGPGNGGTGQAGTPSNGQLLIGDGSNFVTDTLTGTADQIVVANGAGTITLSAPQNLHTTADFKLSTILVKADTGLTLSGQTDGAGAGAGTLSNAPTAGDPAFWLPVKINGTTHFIPAWT